MSAERVHAGVHFISGDEAISEGALAAGLGLFAGYPITPSTEIAERLALRLPEVGGTFVQMEDELASMAAIVGASVTGTRSMTATSGPGFSLMMENIGLAAMMEVPTVIANVMRGGPSTGLPTLVGQGDVFQARFGSHGDYGCVAYAPSSPQECFDLTIQAFNTADRLRAPVFLLADEVIGHLTERVVIPAAADIPHTDRPRPAKGVNGSFKPFGPDPKTMVPPMAYAGEGYRVHFTSLTHDERGYPTMSPAVHDTLVRRLVDKIENKTEELTIVEQVGLDDADVVVVAYGCVARSARLAVRQARAKGIKAGLLRLVTLWPFPEHVLRQVASVASRRIIVAELNLGMMAREVERVIHRDIEKITSPGGAILSPETILKAVAK